MPPHSLLSLFPFSLHLLLLLLPTTNAYIDIFLLPSYNTADRCIKDCISWHISHNLDYFTCRGAKATDNCFCATSEHSTALTRDISRCAVDFCTTGTVVPVAVASATGIFRSYCQTNGYGVAAAGNGVSVSAPVQTNNVQSAAASVTVSSRVGSGSGGSPVSTSQGSTLLPSLNQSLTPRNRTNYILSTRINNSRFNTPPYIPNNRLHTPRHISSPHRLTKCPLRLRTIPLLRHLINPHRLRSRSRRTPRNIPTCNLRPPRVSTSRTKTC